MINFTENQEFINQNVKLCNTLYYEYYITSVLLLLIYYLYTFGNAAQLGKYLNKFACFV